MITRLLIANRGEIACRIIATARSMGLQTVAVHGAPDATARHVAMADLAVSLDGITAAETYLDIPTLIQAARRSGADAVHPGYGFLAENAAFAAAVVDAGLTWVGPSSTAILAMGDKISAKRLMADAGVPILRSVIDPAEVAVLGFPVIVKAAAGGGGKGMRIVAGPEDLADAVAAAQREAASAFGDDRIFIERYLPRPRHIEVQIMADAHGRVVHIGERECSLQRRHQKVIEEAPSPVVDAGTRERLGQAAIAAADAVGYVGAGTVEFVATVPEDGGELAFFFLEMNTRLQVEHPVTEGAWRTQAGPIDLVRLQLLVADGQPLPFGQDDLRLVAHSVEARLYAEDPAAGFLPATGTVELLEPADLPGTRWDTGVRAGDRVSPYFDPMIAKVVATAPTRGEAIALLAAELRATRLHGLVTNRDALAAMLVHPDFAAGALDTGFIERMPAASFSPAVTDATLRTHAAAVVVAAGRSAHAAARVQTSIPAGWRNNRSQPDRETLTIGGVAVEVASTPEVSAGSTLSAGSTASTLTAGSAHGRWTMEIDGRRTEVVLHPSADEDALDLEVDGLRLTVRVTTLAGDDAAGTRWAVDSPLGGTTILQHARFPVIEAEEVRGSLVAPMPGSVLSVEAVEGSTVTKGQTLMLLEAMKMEHRITAPHDGTLADLRVRAGQQVEAGDILAVIDDGTDG